MPYSDVVRFGDIRDQPVLRSRTEISYARPNRQNTVVKRRGTVDRKKRRENRTPPTYRSILPKSKSYKNSEKRHVTIRTKPQRPEIGNRFCLLEVEEGISDAEDEEMEIEYIKHMPTKNKG